MINLRPYQENTLKSLEHLPAIGLFMDTGTGKTFTALFRVRDLPTTKLLVLCPAKVVDQWKAVIPQVLPMYTIPGWAKTSTSVDINTYLKKGAIFRADYTAVVLSLESIARIPFLPQLVDDSWCVIVDESHKIKEYGSKKSPVKVTHAALNIGESTPYKIILTATPTQKEKGGYIDYYTQLRFLGYMDMNHKDFRTRYCVLKKIHPIGMPYPIEVIAGYKNTNEIDKILKASCRRYTATLGDFEPQHTKISLPAPHNYARMSREKAYKELDLTNISARRMAKKTLTGGIIMGHDLFKQPLTYDDNTIKADWLAEFLSNTDETVVVFYKYNVELEMLERVCRKVGKKYVVINGANKEKYKTIQAGGYEVVLGQFAACGESLDGLQHQSHICVYYAMPESSLEHRQALGRINRLGQTKVPMYYYLVADKTIDSDIYDMTEKKIEFSEETLDRLEMAHD